MNHRDVLIKCPACMCEQVFSAAWSVDAQAVVDPAAAHVVVEHWGLELDGCDGNCPCHTGRGLLPRMMITIGSKPGETP